MNECMKIAGVYPKMLSNMWRIVAFINPVHRFAGSQSLTLWYQVFSFLSVCILDNHAVFTHYDLTRVRLALLVSPIIINVQTALSEVGAIVGGPWLRAWVSVDACVVLAGVRRLARAMSIRSLQALA